MPNQKEIVFIALLYNKSRKLVLDQIIVLAANKQTAQGTAMKYYAEKFPNVAVWDLELIITKTNGIPFHNS